MDTILDVINIVLDFACDTRAYSLVSKTAYKQAAVRPDHGVWQKIKTPADYFIHGTATVVSWALVNIPELVALDQFGLTVALTNAVQADNAATAAVLILRVPNHLLGYVTRYCGPATVRLFADPSGGLPRCNRCLVELGFDFAKIMAIDEDDVSGVVSELTDEYLCKLLPEKNSVIENQDLGCMLIELACEYNRRHFALEIVRRYGTYYADHAVRILDGYIPDCGFGLRLMDELSSLSGCKYDRDALRAYNIMCGMVDELDSDGVRRVHKIERQIANGTIEFETLELCGGAMLDTMAKHCSEETIYDLLYRSDFADRWSLSNKLAEIGRFEQLRISDCNIGSLFSNPNTAKYAIGSKLFSRIAFVGLSVNAYILCSKLNGFRD